MSIVFRQVSFRYPLSATDVLRDITFDAPSGSFQLLVGHNGAGKSTLLRLLNGMLRPTTGTIEIDGHPSADLPTSRLAATVAVTFQNPADQLFAATVRDEVAFGPRNLRLPSTEKIVQEALAMCGLVSASEQHPYDLPASERKLLTVASAIAMQTPILAFDEPNAGLSHVERERLFSIFRQLRMWKKSVLVISHDLGLFLPLADQVLALDQGALIFNGHPTELPSAESLLRKTGVRFPLAERVRKMLSREQMVV